MSTERELLLAVSSLLKSLEADGGAGVGRTDPPGQPIHWAGKCPTGLVGYDAVAGAKRGDDPIGDANTPHPPQFDNKGNRCEDPREVKRVRHKTSTRGGRGRQSKTQSELMDLSIACAKLAANAQKIANSDAQCSAADVIQSTEARSAFCGLLVNKDGSDRCHIRGAGQQCVSNVPGKQTPRTEATPESGKQTPRTEATPESGNAEEDAWYEYMNRKPAPSPGDTNAFASAARKEAEDNRTARGGLR
jgi:hypothetical protein